MTTKSQMMDATTSMRANNIATSSRTNVPPTMAQMEKSEKFSGIDFKRGTKTSKELWVALERKYKTEDAGIKKFLVARFLDFKMMDSKSVVSQVQELQVIIHDPLAEDWRSKELGSRRSNKVVSDRFNIVNYPTHSHDVDNGYSDANWITGSNEVKSTSEYVFTISGGAVSWKSFKQTCIARSTMQSEFITLDKAGEEVEWLRNFLEDISYCPKPVAPICIHCDSQAIIGRAGSMMYNVKMTTESQMMDATTSMRANNIATSSHANAPPTMAPAKKTRKFSGIDFKRWQQKMFFYLTTLCLQRFTRKDSPEMQPFSKRHTDSWKDMTVYERIESLMNRHEFTAKILHTRIYCGYNKIRVNAVVAKDCSGKYKTIKAALKVAPDKSKKRFVIYVKKGIYIENVRVQKTKWNIMIIGDGKDATVVSGNRNFIDGTPTFQSATFVRQKSSLSSKLLQLDFETALNLFNLVSPHHWTIEPKRLGKYGIHGWLRSFIHPNGWMPWVGTTAPSTIFYAEHNNFGPGAKTNKRVNWKGLKLKLTSKIVSKFTVKPFTQGDKWLPATGVPFKAGL
ncbi:hypothetical protein FXO37_01708 [Capsicum annuum]|nr:hypothetical protein FXO37_01708 [Capsicum annuum]